MSGVNMAYYRKEDWERFVQIADDGDGLHDTWDEWHEAFLKAKKQLAKKGLKVSDVVIDLDELINYCKKKGIKNDGKARSLFVQQK